MKEDMKVHTCKPSVSSSSLTMRDESHTISNFKPKIRIIHIFAPEIIKTDAANFRELVQRLTGKPEGRKLGGKRVSKKAKIKASQAEQETESLTGYQNSGSCERIKGEEEMCREENSSFLGGLGDFDGLMQELGDFPLLPLNSSRLDVLAESGDASFLL